MQKLAALLTLVLAACATGAADRSLPEATATVEVTNLAPAPGSLLTESSVLSADVKYSITNFQPSAHYYVAPLFASTEGEGRTFNAADRMTEFPRLTTAVGTIEIRYAVHRELRNRNLAHPVRISLFVMERTGAHTTRVIGIAGPYEFTAGS